MHVTPLATATSTDGVVVRQYSDDSRACIEFTIRPDFSSQLQCCLTLAAWAVPTSAWLTLNRVFLNIDKCDLLLTSTARQAPLVGPVPLQSGSSVIKSSTEAKNLGVTLDYHLTKSTTSIKHAEFLPRPHQQDPTLPRPSDGQVRGERSRSIPP